MERILYNVLVALILLGFLVHLRRGPTPRRWLWLNIDFAVLAVVLASAPIKLIGMAPFLAPRLLADVFFFQWPILLVVSAVMLFKPFRRTAMLSVVASVGVIAAGLDAFFIEPTWLEVTRVRVPSAKIRAPVRIVVVADLQTDHLGEYERQVLRRAIDEQPDLLLFAGDYVQAGDAVRPAILDQINVFLHGCDMRVPLGVFAVRGNVDCDDWTALFDGLDVDTIEDTQRFDLGDVVLTCLSLDDSDVMTTDLPAVPEDRYHIIFGHRPDYTLGPVEADLLLAGHCHGGQVRLPLIGPLLTLSNVPRPHCTGLNARPNGGMMYVSRGVGMERGFAPRLRFLCRPELTILELVPQRGSP